ncbi:MAG: DUF4236 domain-containing protein [Acidobacteria bacterium]|nr:DUF4236 domain-containing protein [Acidobacteriota bacterium]
MGFYIRKRVRVGKNTFLNLSKRGASVSQRFGPFTVNSRGRTNVRLGNGLGYRGGCATVLLVPLAVAVASAMVLLGR